MVIARTVNMLNDVLEQARGFDDVELLFTKDRTALTRFMKSRIHQSTEVYARNLRIRVVLDGRCGVVETGRLDQDSLAAALERAREIALAQPHPQSPVELPASRPVADSTCFHESTASAMAFDRAKLVRDLAAMAASCGAEVSGAITTAEETLCVVNTRGTEAYQQRTRAELNLLAHKGGLSGYSYWVGNDLLDLPLDKLAGEALALIDWEGPEGVAEPGTYTVFLDHPAAGMMVAFLALMGFGAKDLKDGSSFMARLMGKKVAAKAVSIWDDGRNPAGLPSYFDHEGVPRRRASLIENGVAAGVVTDSALARALGMENTGHALPSPNPYGPAATNLFMGPGRSTRERMIASVKRGIYVRKFHYVNAVDPMTALITGMTKDGTWLIEEGRLVRPVRNLRFTQGILKALRSCAALSAETRLVEGVYGPVHCPAMLVRQFEFTGVSDQ